MNKYWDITVNFMDKTWDQTLALLSKINNWIPLSMVLFAGFCLLGVVLILAICSCATRKCLVPNWLIWMYFTFATIVIFAHVGNDIVAVVEAIEIPVLVVLLCYVLRVLFCRRSRCCASEKKVTEKQIESNLKNLDKETKSREIETIKENATELSFTQAVEEQAVQEALRKAEEEKEEAKSETVELVTAEPAFEDSSKNETENLFTEELSSNESSDSASKNEEVVNTVEDNQAVTLPTVNPIPDKVYQPAPEPTIVVKPVSETVPTVNTNTANTSRTTTTSTKSYLGNTSTSRSNSFTTNTSVRPTTSSTITRTTTLNRPTSSISRPVTTSTLNRSTTTSSFTRPVATNTSSSTTVKTTTTTTSTNSTTPRSTEDIMAAIERLRASMKK
ncbi:MAG: hypothetical protein MJ054_00470 [Clostridia bacterium]|nr:hypothetical protein [Clostridia bacterium]